MPYQRKGTRSRVKRKRTYTARGGTRSAVRRKSAYARTGGFSSGFSQGSETKFHDVALDDAVVAAAGTVTPTINIIPQGVLENERVGRKCVIKKVYWKYTITLPQQDAVAQPASGDAVRAILYVDKQCNGATATVANILASADWQSFRALENTGRFVILMDKTHSINYMGLGSDGAGVVSQAQVQQPHRFFKNCSIPIEFDNSASTGVLTTIRTNNLGVLLIARSGVAGFDSDFRLRFSDN